MNKKCAVELLSFSKKVFFGTTIIFYLGLVSTVHAQQSVIENPMLSSAPMRYGSYSHSVSRVQIQPVTPSATQAKTTRTVKKEASVGTVNINSASEIDLAALPGIGPSKARAITEYRQQQGGFKSIDDLQQVKGIGPATLEKLRAHVTL